MSPPDPSLERCLRCSSGVLDARLGGMCGDSRYGQCPSEPPCKFDPSCQLAGDVACASCLERHPTYEEDEEP